MQDLDIEEYSKMLQDFKSYDIKPVLQFIIRELTHPYRFYPQSDDLIYTEPDPTKIFYYCTGESP